MKGSWNIINGAVENSVTWDTNCAAEDFWFGFNVSSVSKFRIENPRPFLVVCIMLLMSDSLFGENRPHDWVINLVGSTPLHESSLQRPWRISFANGADGTLVFGRLTVFLSR
jgi:hypothetical protein